MGCGKSKVGRLLARLLGWTFVDVDEQIVRRQGRSITSIFQHEGEAAFRRYEREALIEILGKRRQVISTGGGLPMSPANRATLRKCFIVWLEAKPSTAYQRVKNKKSRPLLLNADPLRTLAVLISSRSPVYSKADIRVNGEIEAPLRAKIIYSELQKWR